MRNDNKAQRSISRNRKLSLETKNAFVGFAFAIPFCIGFIFFFLMPLIQSFSFAFSDVTVEIGGYKTVFVGIQNFYNIFRVDLDYTGNLVNSFSQLAWRVPVVILSSLFIALIIKQEFKGRILVRAIFFLPVIISSGVIMDTIKLDMVAANTMAGNTVTTETVFQSQGLITLLQEAGLNEKIVNVFSTISNNFFDVIYNGGVQMLLFLAAIQGVSPTLYEAASVEGATAWESFWNITVPMVLPIILVNIIYTIVDCFTASSNRVMVQVMSNVELLQFGTASAMLWVYCISVLLLLGIIFLIFRRIGNNET